MRYLNPLSPHRSGRRKAFSLIELTLALGIVSFAFVGIFALLPIGMTNMRTAIDTTVTHSIYQSILNDAQLTSFSRLVDPDGFMAEYRDGAAFDEQGNRLPVGESDARYIATVKVITPVTIPGATAERQNLARVEVTVQAQFSDARPKVSFVVVPDNGL